MKRVFVAAIAAVSIACVGLAGCASLESFLDKNSIAAKLVVQEATARVIEAGHGTADQQARAQKVVSIASGIKQTWDTASSDLPGIIAIAAERVAALKLGPADALLAQALIDALAQEIQLKVCPGSAPGAACTIPQNLTLYVDTTIGWIVEAASLYVPKT